MTDQPGTSHCNENILERLSTSHDEVTLAELPLTSGQIKAT